MASKNPLFSLFSRAGKSLQNRCISGGVQRWKTLVQERKVAKIVASLHVPLNFSFSIFLIESQTVERFIFVAKWGDDMTYEYRDVNVRKHDRRHPKNPSRSVHVRRHSRHQRVSSGKPEQMNYLMAGKPPQEESDYPDIPQGKNHLESNIHGHKDGGRCPGPGSG